MKTWTDVLGQEKQKPYFQAVLQQVRAERAAGQTVYPPEKEVFNAFRYTPWDKVKVVILGQDPYHNEHQAHGLAFSVQKGCDIPPSLANIYKELSNDIAGFQMPAHGCLTDWAEQGVLLLNTVLTVRAHQAHSHAGLGWETFTDTVIRALNEYGSHLVFLLWGSHAQKKRPGWTNRAIWCCARRILRRCRLIAAFSAAAIFRRPMRICRRTDWRRLIGRFVENTVKKQPAPFDMGCRLLFRVGQME